MLCENNTRLPIAPCGLVSSTDGNQSSASPWLLKLWSVTGAIHKSPFGAVSTSDVYTGIAPSRIFLSLAIGHAWRGMRKRLPNCTMYQLAHFRQALILPLSTELLKGIIIWSVHRSRVLYSNHSHYGVLHANPWCQRARPRAVFLSSVLLFQSNLISCLC
jgi:hypothetical protein